MTLISIFKIVHLFGLIMGFGGAIAADLTILRHAILSPIQQKTIELSKILSHIVFAGLALLWISGAMLVYLRVSADPNVLTNQKIWAKVIIVCILTINGFAVHKIALGHLVARRGFQLFDKQKPIQMAGLAFVAAVSGVSWLVPFILGVASEFNFTVKAVTILAIYANMVLMAWCMFLALGRFVTSHNFSLEDRTAFKVESAGPNLRIEGIIKPITRQPLEKIVALLNDARFAWIHERRAKVNANPLI